MARGLNAVQIEVGRRIRAAREARGWSQETLAHEAELTMTYLSQVERGTRNPTVAALFYLCRALGISLAQLFAES